MFKIQLPEDVSWIINELEKAGHEAYAVGGCVRDSLLGRQPADWDITTSAQPLEVKKLFRRTVDTGLQHGTVTIMLKENGYEVTTYRVDGEYHDHRRPDSVTFTSNLEEDLKRRDFTINAMAYNNRSGLVDLFQGAEDLKAGVIRAVGNPDERFDEDALRIMRAVRFAAQLGFTIDQPTKDAAKKHAPELSKVSAERIETELTKLLLSDHPELLETAYELGMTKVFLPEFDKMMETPQHNPYHKYDVGHHTIEVIRHVPKTKTLRYAALLHDSGKPETKTTDERGIDHFKGHAMKSEDIAGKVLKRLRMDNDTIRDVKKIVYWHDFGLKGDVKINTFRKAMSKMGIQYFDSLIAIKKADMQGQSEYHKEDSINSLNSLIRMKEMVDAEGAALTIKELAVTGKDLIDAGVKPGPEMGRILGAMLDLVLENPELNEKDLLMKKLGEL